MPRPDLDRTEWYDILYGLSMLGAGKGDRIYEFCAGDGAFLEFLRSRGFENVDGCDIRPGGGVEWCDLEKAVPPRADYFVFQHCIEHLSWRAAVRILRLALRRGYGVVGIVPGHKSYDPTHRVNHFDRRLLMELVREVGPRYYWYGPDSWSYVAPWDNDWLLVLSNMPLRRFAPWFSRYGVVRLWVAGFRRFYRLVYPGR